MTVSLQKNAFKGINHGYRLKPSKEKGATQHAEVVRNRLIEQFEQGAAFGARSRMSRVLTAGLLVAGAVVFFINAEPVNAQELDSGADKSPKEESIRVTRGKRTKSMQGLVSGTRGSRGSRSYSGLNIDNYADINSGGQSKDVKNVKPFSRDPFAHGGRGKNRPTQKVIVPSKKTPDRSMPGNPDSQKDNAFSGIVDIGRYDIPLQPGIGQDNPQSIGSYGVTRYQNIHINKEKIDWNKIERRFEDFVKELQIKMGSTADMNEWYPGNATHVLEHLGENLLWKDTNILDVYKQIFASGGKVFWFVQTPVYRHGTGWGILEVQQKEDGSITITPVYLGGAYAQNVETGVDYFIQSARANSNGNLGYGKIGVIIVDKEGNFYEIIETTVEKPITGAVLIQTINQTTTLSDSQRNVIIELANQ